MIIGNGVVITNDAKNHFYKNGAVYVKDNVIQEVGNFEDIKAKYPNEEIVDVKGNVIMPGMICAHSHIYSAYARGMSVSKPTDDFYNVLENLWWSLDRQLTLEDVKLNALTTYMESIRNGTTTVIDHHSGPNSMTGSLFTIADAAKEVGMRTSLCAELTDRDGEAARDKCIKENVDFIKACQKDDHGDMIKGLFGIHASFTVSDESLYKAREAMEGVYDGYHVHIAEGIEDQWDTLKMTGKRVIDRFNDFDMLGERSIAVHCVHASEREIDILKHNDTSVVHNPESNMNNAVGAPPVVHMLEKGIRVGLGTDSYTQDMFESLKVANILQAHETADPTKGFGESIQLLFKNNKAILAKYFNKPLGVLEEGAYADLITVEYEPITPLTANNWNGHVLFGMQGAMVMDNMINGKFVMRNRELTTVDESAIKAKSREGAARVWANL